MTPTLLPSLPPGGGSCCGPAEPDPRKALVGLLRQDLIHRITQLLATTSPSTTKCQKYGPSGDLPVRFGALTGMELLRVVGFQCAQRRANGGTTHSCAGP